ncbi:formin-like protein 20 [Primulina tabacum]|uniref:formin-like protein 20 n=1 Tax=Primulina tabacum TaxID=48773 RepID=UPI003F598A11
MALFRRLFYKKPPDRLLEISERVYVFDCCFSTDVLDEDEYRAYMNGIVSQLQDNYPDAAFMVFNFKEGERRSQISDVLSQYDMTVMDYPRQYEGCPLLPLEMIHHFLRSSESWLSLEGQQNVLLMHCEWGGWPVLAFMLAGLLLYRKQYMGEQKTLEMVYKQAPRELLHLMSSSNSQPSQLRFLQYISRRNLDWPPPDTPLALDCIILRVLPLYNGGKGCRPVVRIYGQDPSSKTSSRSSKLLFSTSKRKKHIRLYRMEECELVKMDIHCRVQGDVVVECIHLGNDQVTEEMIFRVMFHTAFIRSNVLMLTRDEIDVLWDSRDQFSKDFRVEVLFSDADSVPPIVAAESASEDGNETESASPDEFFEAEEIFSNVVDGHDVKGESNNQTVQPSAQNGRSHHEVAARKDNLDHHAFQDCASNEGSYRPDHKFDSSVKSSKGNTLHDCHAQSKSRTVIADNVFLSTKSMEKQGSLQKFASDSIKDMSDKGLSAIPKKQPCSSLKPSADSVGTSKKSKQQESQGSMTRQAKPTAVSRWIPSNKGSYTNSMHVYYPYLRHNSVPPDLAAGKDSPPCGKAKLQAVTASSETSVTGDRTESGRGRYRSPTSSDLSPSRKASFRTLPSSPLVKHEALELSLAFQPPSSLIPPPPPSSSCLVYKSSLPPMTIAQEVENPSSSTLVLPSNHVSFTPSPHPSLFSFKSTISFSSSESPSSPSLPHPLPPSTISTTTSLRKTINCNLSLPPPPPPSPPYNSTIQNVPRPPPPPPLTRGPPKQISHSTGIPYSVPPPHLLSMQGNPPPAPPPPSQGSPFSSRVTPSTPPISILPCAPPPPPPPPAPPGGSLRQPSSALPPLLPPTHGMPPPPPPPIRGAPFPPTPPVPGAPPPPPPLHGSPSPPPPTPPMTGGAPPSPPVPGAPAAPPLPGCHVPGPPIPPGPPRYPGSAPPPPPLFSAKGPATDGSGISAGRERPLGLSTVTTPRRSTLKPLHWSKVTRVLQGSLWEEFQRHGEPQVTSEFDVSELETLFSTTVPKSDNAGGQSGGRRKSVGSKLDKVHLIDLRRANNTEIMLTKVKMPLPDMMAAALAMDESILDADQVENLIKFCPTKEEMELLKGYTGDMENLGKCEQFFLELMKVPRVESKLRVFLFKIQFNSQVSDFKKSLNIVNSACEEVRMSIKLKEILKKILYLGNTLNQGTARGSAIGFKLDSLLKLADTRATNNKMTLMHYLCKVLASKSPSLLDFHEDLVSMEAASKIQLKSLAEEMQAIIKGLEKVKQELLASENDGHVSENFYKTLKDFVYIAEIEVSSVTNLYSVAGRNADALALYFGEDPARCPFEQVPATLLNFVRLFRKAHEENCKQDELEKKKAQKEAEMENPKGINLTPKGTKH